MAPRTPLLLALLALAPHPHDERSPAGEGDQATRWIWFDWVEDGALRGGRIREEQGDPLRSRVELPPLLGGGGSVTVVDSGPASNRVDIVFVGDGYTAAELGIYAAQVDAAAAGLLAEPPFDVYANLVNVHRVDVVSAESGVDNDPTEGILRDTALDMGFWCGGTERLLCVNVGKAIQQAEQAPGSDQVLAIANSTKYGGAGYASSDLATYSAGSSSAFEIALHELGHSMGNLADEYWDAGETYAGGEPWQANVTILDASEMLSQGAKWHLWLAEPNVGLFEGGVYNQFGVWRPTSNSKMRNLGRPFEQVNLEQLVAEIYREVDPIDSATPPGVYGETQVFTVNPVDPIGHALDVSWLLDGVPMPGVTGTSLDPSTLGLANGSYELAVEVVDPTPLVRDPAIRETLLTSRRDWTLAIGVSAGPPSIATAGSVSGAPLTETFLVTGANLDGTSSVTLGFDPAAFEVIDASTLSVGPLVSPEPGWRDLTVAAVGGTTFVQDIVGVWPALSAVSTGLGGTLTATLRVDDDPGSLDVGFLFLGFGLLSNPLPVDSGSYWGLELTPLFPIVELGGKAFVDEGAWALPLPANPDFFGVPIHLQAWSALGAELEGPSFSNTASLLLL